jgi:hypothetical protein
MPNFKQVSPDGQSAPVEQITTPLHALAPVHVAPLRLAQQTWPEAHVLVPHFGPPVPPLLLELPPKPLLLPLLPWPLLLPLPEPPLPELLP